MIFYIRLDYISNVFSYLIESILSQNLTKVLGFSVFFVFFLWRQEVNHMIQSDLETSDKGFFLSIFFLFFRYMFIG